MNDSNRTSLWQRSPLIQFFIWLFSWRGFRSILILLGCAVVLILMLYAKENWQGRHQWNKYRRQLEDQGEKLDLRAFIPKSIPDDQNFAAAPIVQSWFNRGDPPPIAASFSDDDYSAASGMISNPDKNKNTRDFIDLEAWAAAFNSMQNGEPERGKKVPPGELSSQSRSKAAPLILDALESSEPILAELRTAAMRPAVRYPINYDLENPWAILLPHLAKLKAACQRLQLKACAHLAAGQTESAFKDVELMLYLADSMEEEFFLISQLVRIACVNISIQPIWEGLAENRWSRDQLRALQARLLEFNFIAAVHRSLEAEQAAGIRSIELVQEKGLGYLQELQSLQTHNPSHRFGLNALNRLIPNGWYELEKYNYCRFRHMLTGTAIDLAQKRISPGQIKANNREFDRQLNDPGFMGREANLVLKHRLLSALLLPALGKVVFKSSVAQVTTDQAAVACALEQYRMANEKFPDTLQALVPNFIAALPKDTLTGEPFKYAKAGDNQFTLYSIGWDENDDEGTPGNTMFSESSGDWVWSYTVD